MDFVQTASQKVWKIWIPSKKTKWFKAFASNAIEKEEKFLNNLVYVKNAWDICNIPTLRIISHLLLQLTNINAVLDIIKEDRQSILAKNVKKIRQSHKLTLIWTALNVCLTKKTKKKSQFRLKSQLFHLFLQDSQICKVSSNQKSVKKSDKRSKRK